MAIDKWKDAWPLKVRLNESSRSLLSVRQQSERFARRFSLVFMGDTHIGKICCLNDIVPENEYRRLLSVVLGDGSDDILCIVHGGDATDRGEENLKRFLKVTKSFLSFKSRHGIIPFFLNIGNHEYLDDPEGEAYRLLVCDPGQVQYIWLDSQRFGLALLDTGTGDRGGFENAKRFSDQLLELETEMRKKPDYLFIIDMHIPPAWGWGRLMPLGLNNRDTREFLHFLNRNPEQIMAVITHHRHWLIPSCSPQFYQKRIPVFVTAHAGHCDFPRLASLRLTFSRVSSAGWEMKPSLIRV